MAVRPLAFDSETALIRPALLAPPPACFTWQRPGLPAKIVHAHDAEPVLREWLKSDSVLVGHNLAFDMAVVCERYPALRDAVFRAYDEDRCSDTMIRQWLLDTAAGVFRGRVGEKGRWFEHKYGLEDVAKRCANIVLQKDGWRLSYGALIDTPLERWPEKAREMQAAAGPRVAELDRQIDFYAERKDEATVKALIKERDGLKEMIAGEPSRVSDYPLDDARATLAVFEAQEKHVAYLADQYRQARAYFALYLSSAHGLRTDPEGVEILRRETQAAYDELEEELMQLGLIRADKKRSRDTKLAKARMIRVCAEEGITLRRTDGHTEDSTKCKDADGNPLPGGHDDCVEHVCLDAEACSTSPDDVLNAYGEVTTLKKVLSNDIKMLTKGVLYPVHTQYGWAETGRTTSSKPPIQNLCKRPGIREAFVPREGCVFFSCDYPALELFTWSQCCVTWLGKSKLADALNEGLDPHLMMAGTMLGLSYEDALAAYVRCEKGVGSELDEEVVDMRQLAKPANFGFPGGMGAKTFYRTLLKQLSQTNKALLEKLKSRLDENGEPWLTEARGKWLREMWESTWPEARLHFDRIKALGPPYPETYRATVQSLWTKRFRGNTTYCAASNDGFQGLGADCAKEALWRVARAQYVEHDSPLFNTRTVAFVHDEIIGECREEVLHEAGHELARVMREAANIYLPDVPIPASKMKPAGMRRWSKKARPVFDSSGRLIPWTA